MLPARIRQMTPADVPAVTTTLIDADFGDRAGWLAFATGHPACRTLVAEADGAIVGTGVGTSNGPAGWLATIWVAAGHRRRGLGRALTQELIDQLGTEGCRTFILVATDQGRHLYEAMGFREQARYRIFEAPSEAPVGPPDRAVRPFEPGDLPDVLALDRIATGEDRRHALAAFATSASARVLDVDGRIRGFVVRAPWGGGATVAPEPGDALRLLDARRRAGGPSGRVRAGLLEDNAVGLALLESSGYRPIWSAPRLILGEPLPWRPEWIWGQFNHAIG